MRATVPGLALFLATSVFAQPLRETATVEIVEVPVYVRRGAQAVTDLTRANFALFVNGKQQDVEYFDVIDFASGTTTADLRQRRLYYLLFDLTSDPAAIARARRAVDHFVDAAHDDVFFAVGTIGASRGFQTVAPFTRDRFTVRQALRAFETRSRDPLRMGVVIDKRPVDRSDRFADEEDFGEADESMKDLAMESRRRETHGLFRGLDEVARQLSSLEGHKHVVLFTTGFDAEIVDGVQRAARPLANWMQGPVSGADLILPSAASMNFGAPMPGSPYLPRAAGALMQSLQELSARYARASVFLHAVDSAGIRASGVDNDSLHMLARSGEVVANRNNLGDALRYLSDVQRVVYVLGFRPPLTRKTSNTITVRLRDVPGAKATYRRSYSTSPVQSSSDELRLADIVTNDVPQNGVSLGLLVNISGHGTSVNVLIRDRELRAFGERVEAQLLVYVFSGLRLVAWRGKNIHIDGRQATPLDDAPLSLRQTFNLPPGKYTTKVLLRVMGSEALGFVRADFVVP